MDKKYMSLSAGMRGYPVQQMGYVPHSVYSPFRGPSTINPNIQMYHNRPILIRGRLTPPNQQQPNTNPQTSDSLFIELNELKKRLIDFYECKLLLR